MLVIIWVPGAGDGTELRYDERCCGVLAGDMAEFCCIRVGKCCPRCVLLSLSPVSPVWPGDQVSGVSKTGTKCTIVTEMLHVRQNISIK